MFQKLALLICIRNQKYTDTKKEFEEKFNELSKIKFPKPTILGIAKEEAEFINYALEIASLKE